MHVWLIINTFAHNSKIKIMKKGININRIISLYEEGKNSAEISEILGCCPANITKRFAKDSHGCIILSDATNPGSLEE